MPKVDDFVHFHLHSDMSQLDGCAKIGDYVQRAKERGNVAIGFSDHGTMRGYYEELEETKKHDIKPIYGCEFYVANDMTRKGLTAEEKEEITKGLAKSERKEAIKKYEELHGIRDRWHLTVWAKNEVGMRNLFKLTSQSWTEGFYYKPRIDLDRLIQHGEGLAVATGCLSSPVNDHVLAGRKKRSLELSDKLYEGFGTDLWLELQPHALEEQTVANQHVISLKDRYPDLGFLACQDAHYLDREDAAHHDVLLCIGTNDYLSNPNRFSFDGDEFHFRTRKEMEEAFQRNHPYMKRKHIKEACDNTIVLAEQCDVPLKVDFHACLMPEINVPEAYGGDMFAYMKDLCIHGISWRDIPGRAKRLAARKGESRDYHTLLKIYRDRLKMELNAIKRQKYVSYFLLVHDLYGWVRKQKIACGPGRGSAAGSLVSFLMGITSVDPIEHGLIFERFISPSRIDMPDIDMDFEDIRRQEIIDHIVEKYGRDRVCQIATLGKLSGKQCLKDVSRVLEVPYAEVNAVTGSIIERSSGDERASQTIADSFKEFKVCRDFDAKYPDVLKHSKRLEGMTKTLGIHAAGVVVGPEDLTNIIPLETRTAKKGSTERIVVSALDMYGCAAFGLLKLDVLGLRTMAVLRMACQAAGYDGAEMLEQLPLDDPEVLKGFTDHDYVGIFQYDSPGADKVCSGVEFVHFEDIAAMTALNRPGTARSGLASQYVDRKKNPEKVKESSFHPKVSEITSDTLGIIVYQEHVLKIFTEVAGFAPATADSLRKTIAKKIGDETMGKERANFVKGAMENTPGMTEKIAHKIMDAITFFGSYGFNKSHATSYGMIAYWGMWLKVHHPIEFYWALMVNEPDRLAIQKIARDAKSKGIQILPPDVSKSGAAFTIDREANAIRGSLVDIKNVGLAACNAVVESAPYKSILDFLRRVDKRRCNKRVVKSLATAGALDELLPNPKYFIENMDEIWKLVGKKSKAAWREVGKKLIASASEEQYSDEDRMLVASSVNPLAFGKHPMEVYDDFIARSIGVPIDSMGRDDFFAEDHNCWVAGIILEVKYNQVGDFHTGALPSEAEMERMGWGKRYANVNVEDASGKQNRIKVDWDIFDEFRHIVDLGVGTAVLVHAKATARYENMRAHILIHLEEMRQKESKGEPFQLWERIASGDHPVFSYHWKSEEMKEAAESFKHGPPKRGYQKFTGVITNRKEKKDKKDNLMGFFGLIGPGDQHIDVLCFASSWSSYGKHIKNGRLATLKLKVGDGAYILGDGGEIVLHNKSSDSPKRS